MTPEDLAEIHAAAFAGTTRAWGTAEFKDLLRSEHVFVAANRHAFALGRALAGEAELLTLACAPKYWGQGFGRQALAAFEAEAKARAAQRFFLEVASDNSSALALYTAAGYREIARRKGYYAQPGRDATDAIIMEKNVP